MTKLYSKTTGGFYDRSVHGAAIPPDAIDITDAEHAALLTGQSTGKRISVGNDGKPGLTDQPSVTTAELAARGRIKRDELISETDYLVMPDYPVTPARLAAIKTYRQALRDVPAQSGFPQTINWPAKP